jgi:hypothetical protein
VTAAARKALEEALEKIAAELDGARSHVEARELATRVVDQSTSYAFMVGAYDGITANAAIDLRSAIRSYLNPKARTP